MTTELQAAMIKRIALNEFSQVNGSVPASLDDIGWIWADIVIETAQDKGCFTSLVNAGLAIHCGSKGRDACVALTAEGFAEYQRLTA